MEKIATHNSATGEAGRGILSFLVAPFSKCLKWMGEDGMAHVIGSAVICSALNVFLCPLLALVTTAFVGLAKEVYDHKTRTGTPEKKDLICDLIGIAITTIPAVS